MKVCVAKNLAHGMKRLATSGLDKLILLMFTSHSRQGIESSDSLRVLLTAL